MGVPTANIPADPSTLRGGDRILAPMPGGYRATTPSCPSCGAAMEPRPIKGSTIDVCPECAGVWADWFDGDLRAVIRQAPERHGLGAGSTSAAGCPRCRIRLDDEPLPGSVECVIFRCSECFGAFVPRASFEAVLDAAARGVTEAAPSTPLGRLAALLTRLLG
jgi:Zn-finger nucleic acid-binding protein